MNLENSINKVLDSYAEIAAKQPEAIKLLESVYAKLFDEKLQIECGTCNLKAFHKIQRKAFFKNIEMKKTDQKYQLKDGITLDFRHTKLSAETLTDEKAESLLKEYPHFCKYFKTVPETATAEMVAEETAKED